MRRTIFSQTAVLCGMFLPLFLAVAANNLFATDYDGEWTVDGGEITIGNGIGVEDTADRVTVNNHGRFSNGRNGGTGIVDIANVQYGYFYNGNEGGTGTVGTATINNGGYFNGSYGGTGNVGTATLYGGEFYNGIDGTGNVGTATLNGGTFCNGYYGTGTVSTATLNGGAFYNGLNGGTGNVGTATLNGGTFINGNGGTGTVETATLNGGTFYNGYYANGNVDHLIYNNGDYQANVKGRTSSIGTLTLGKKVSESQGKEFMKSNLKELAFSQNYGVINITGTADAANNLAFANNINVSAPTIDLTGTNIAVNVAALLTGNASSDPLAFLFNTYFATDGFSLASLFNDRSTITGGDAIEDLWFSWGSGDADSVHLIENGDINLAAGFSWTNETRTAIAWTSLPETSGSAATPEPATLALFGLGIAGLAAMRKRQR